MIRWNLTGTEQQRAIAFEALSNRILFPWDRLTNLPGVPELGWRNLNTGIYALAAQEDRGRFHEGQHGEDRPHGIEGIVDGRRFTLGVIYTMSGRIYIDETLTAKPMEAMTTISAEIAHAVDFFLPEFTDDVRNEFLRLWGRGGTWWEVSDYGNEYFTLGGEAFMREFTQAYAPSLDFSSISGFRHDSGVEPQDVYRILGIPRTDYVPPAPEPAPPPKTYVRYGTSLIYHTLTHKVRSKYPPMSVVPTANMRPCKVCKPGVV